MLQKLKCRIPVFNYFLFFPLQVIINLKLLFFNGRILKLIVLRVSRRDSHLVQCQCTFYVKLNTNKQNGGIIMFKKKKVKMKKLASRKNKNLSLLYGSL